MPSSDMPRLWREVCSPRGVFFPLYYSLIKAVVNYVGDFLASRRVFCWSPFVFFCSWSIGLYPFCFFFVCFLLLFWAEHRFKEEAFLLVTSAYFGRICSHFCSLKCTNYSCSCFARSISARCVVSARYVLQIPPFLLYVQRLYGRGFHSVHNFTVHVLGV